MRWFVTMGGGYLPYHAICLSYKSGLWWVERYHRSVGASVDGDRPLTATTWRAVNREVVYFGLDNKRVAAYGLSQLDGALDDPLFSGSVLASSFDTVTLPANVAIPVNASILITRGPGLGQVRRVVELLADNRVRVQVPWRERPTADSQYQVAGIKATYRTGRMVRQQSEGNAVSGFTYHWRPVSQPASGIPRGDQKRYRPTSKVYGAVRAYDGWDTKPAEQQANQSLNEYGGAIVEQGKDYTLVDMTAPVGNVKIREDFHRADGIRAMRTTTMEITVIAGPATISLRQLDTSAVASTGGQG